MSVVLNLFVVLKGIPSMEKLADVPSNVVFNGKSSSRMVVQKVFNIKHITVKNH